jgi:hypothetical protein
MVKLSYVIKIHYIPKYACKPTSTTDFSPQCLPRRRPDEFLQTTILRRMLRSLDRVHNQIAVSEVTQPSFKKLVIW